MMFGLIPVSNIITLGVWVLFLYEPARAFEQRVAV